MRRTLLTFAIFTLSACGGTSVGNECTETANCDSGQTCYTQLPGGYCSKGCSVEGSTTECPGGTVCSNHSNILLCAPTCQTKEDCRADYECNGLSGSEEKSCRPKI